MTWPLVLLCIFAPFGVLGVRLTRSLLHERKRKQIIRAHLRAKAQAAADRSVN